MARLSTTFSGLPRNNNARKRTMRDARLGIRPFLSTAQTGDAFRAVNSVRVIKDALITAQDRIPFLKSLDEAWANRTQEHWDPWPSSP